MSGNIGSAYGIGAYGRGPYSRNPLADAAVTVNGASRISFRPESWRNATLTIDGGGVVTVTGGILWDKLAIPPCHPWNLIASGGCYRALANSAGAMFP